MKKTGKRSLAAFSGCLLMNFFCKQKPGTITEISCRLIFQNYTFFMKSSTDELADIIDETAERIRSLGFISRGRLIDFLELTELEEQDYTTKAKKQMNNLIHDHEIIIRYLRQSITDFDKIIRIWGPVILLRL